MGLTVVDCGNYFFCSDKKIQNPDSRRLAWLPAQHLTEENIPVPGSLGRTGSYIVLAVSAHMDKAIAPDMGLEKAGHDIGLRIEAIVFLGLDEDFFPGQAGKGQAHFLPRQIHGRCQFLCLNRPIKIFRQTG